MKIGITLSGGGARGIVHIGVLKALEEMGVKISVISATSAGAIVGSLYAYGIKPDQIFEQIKQLTLLKSMRPAWTWAGLLTMDWLKELIVKNIPENDFSALKIPVTIAATEIRKGQVQYFFSGELTTAVVASCSIPAIFSPVHVNNDFFVDGGLLDNLPASVIRDQCDFLIGSHCNEISQEFDPKNMKVVIERSLLIAIWANTRHSMDLCDVMIRPPKMDRFTVFDLSRAQEIYDYGYQFTKENFKSSQFQKATAA